MQTCTFTRGVAAGVSAPRLAATRPVGRVFAPVVAKVADTRRARVAERHRRLRNKLEGTTERPRLAIFRSNEHMYAQIIDDTTGHTLAAVNTVQKAVKAEVGDEGNCSNKSAAAIVGRRIAEMALAKNITMVAFDRGGFNYHGRVQAVAEAAREGGLSF